jgi:hypothetical protein
MRFIETKDIRAGDTIVWRTAHPIHKLNYMVVEDIEESEEKFLRYVGGIAVWGNEEQAAYTLIGKVMCESGLRTDYPQYPGPYRIKVGPRSNKIILINRKGEV